MKHIVLFSGGACSSEAAQIVARKQNEKDVIFLYTPTYAEHPDADRFRKQVSQYLGIPITVAAEGRTLWKMIEDYNCMPNNRLPFCTLMLKQRVRERFLKELDDDYILYYGFDLNEYLRAQNIMAHAETNGEKVSFPLLDFKITGDQAKKIIQHEWKICLPEPYLYLEHNNCIPCYKGGKGHFKKVWRHYQAEFIRAAELEELVGHTIFGDISLKDLSKKWEREPETEDLFGEAESIPCLCSF